MVQCWGVVWDTEHLVREYQPSNPVAGLPHFGAGSSRLIRDWHVCSQQLIHSSKIWHNLNSWMFLIKYYIIPFPWAHPFYWHNILHVPKKSDENLAQFTTTCNCISNKIICYSKHVHSWWSSAMHVVFYLSYSPAGHQICKSLHIMSRIQARFERIIRHLIPLPKTHSSLLWNFPLKLLGSTSKRSKHNFNSL